MSRISRTGRRSVLGATALLAAPSIVRAQAYPARIESRAAAEEYERAVRYFKRH